MNLVPGSKSKRPEAKPGHSAIKLAANNNAHAKMLRRRKVQTDLHGISVIQKGRNPIQNMDVL